MARSIWNQATLLAVLLLLYKTLINYINSLSVFIRLVDIIKSIYILIIRREDTSQQTLDNEVTTNIFITDGTFIS